MNLRNISKAKKYSDEKIAVLNDGLSEIIAKKSKGSKFSIITGGSYARREASEQSDIDFFIICDNEIVKKKIESFYKDISAYICNIVCNPPAKDGAFAQIETINEMVENVGGQHDPNDKLTRRILFLMEGEFLYNKKKFINYRKKIIQKYIKKGITDHQLSTFLLNDVIRYYRTVCVDFEYKTIERSKPWATRNIKLIYSRKLLYFASVLVCAETVQRNYTDKIETTEKLLSLTPIERIQEICGTRSEKALKLYDVFLGEISKKDVRSELNRLTMNNARGSETFLRLKNGGHHFTWELLKLLKETYHPTHPINRALIM
jgi:predicted nucleotidyltransferase